MQGITLTVVTFQIPVSLDLIDEMREEYIPEGSTVLDIVPPEFKELLDDVYIRQLRSPRVNGRNLWDIYTDVIDRVKRRLAGIPPTFVDQMRTRLNEDEREEKTAVPLLEGYNKLRGRPRREESTVEPGAGEWEQLVDYDGDESDDYAEDDDPLYEIELTEDEA